MYILVLCLKHGYWYVVRPVGIACGSPREDEADNILEGRYGKYKVIEIECPPCAPQLGGRDGRNRLARPVVRL